MDMDTGFRKCFEAVCPQFKEYLIREELLAEGTIRDYLSWLRYLSAFSRIDTTFTGSAIEGVLRDHEKAVRKGERMKYKRDKDISNFRSALNKFICFLGSSYASGVWRKVYEGIENDPNLSATEKEAMIWSRRGQSLFRRRLIDYWGGCAISECKNEGLLVASHIKPWKDSTSDERLDLFNGLLLLPNYDRLFDEGYMTFTPEGKALYSKLLSVEDKILLGLTDGLSLRRVEDGHKKYLEYHNEHCFRR